jgi:hypothetical protein
MDFGKAGAASSANQALETVGKIDGAKNNTFFWLTVFVVIVISVWLTQL